MSLTDKLFEILAEIEDTKEIGLVRQARHDVFKLDNSIDLLRLPRTIKLLRELESYVIENYDLEGIGNLAVTFSKVANYTRNPKLTRDLMGAVAWYAGRDSFEEIVTSVSDLADKLINTPKCMDHSIEKQFTKRNLRKLSKVLKQCYNEPGEECLAKLINSYQSHYNLNLILGFLENYHDKQGVNRMKDHVINMNIKGENYIDGDVFSSDAKEIITLYQRKKIVDSVAEFVTFVTSDGTLYDQWAEILAMPEVVSALDQFEPENISSNLVSCIYSAVQVTDDVAAIKPVLQVLNEYHGQEGGNHLINSFEREIYKRGTTLREVTEHADYFTMPEIRRAVNSCQGNGYEDKIVSCILNVGKSDPSRGSIKRVANFFADYSDDHRIMNFFLDNSYISNFHEKVSYSLENIDKFITMINLFDLNNSNSKDFNEKSFDKYFGLLYSAIENDEVRNSLPLATINKLVGTYDFFYKIIEDYSLDESRLAEDSFFRILNKKVASGDTLDKKTMIVAEWSHNVKLLIEENIGEINFGHTISRYFTEVNAA